MKIEVRSGIVDVTVDYGAEGAPDLHALAALGWDLSRGVTHATLDGKPVALDPKNPKHWRKDSKGKPITPGRGPVPEPAERFGLRLELGSVVVERAVGEYVSHNDALVAARELAQAEVDRAIAAEVERRAKGK